MSIPSFTLRFCNYLVQCFLRVILPGRRLIAGLVRTYRAPGFVDFSYKDVVAVLRTGASESVLLRTYRHLWVLSTLWK